MKWIIFLFFFIIPIAFGLRIAPLEFHFEAVPEQTYTQNIITDISLVAMESNCSWFQTKNTQLSLKVPAYAQSGIHSCSLLFYDTAHPQIKLKSLAYVHVTRDEIILYTINISTFPVLEGEVGLVNVTVTNKGNIITPLFVSISDIEPFPSVLPQKTTSAIFFHTENSFLSVRLCEDKLCTIVLDEQTVPVTLYTATDVIDSLLMKANVIVNKSTVLAQIIIENPTSYVYPINVRIHISKAGHLIGSHTEALVAGPKTTFASITVPHVPKGDMNVSLYLLSGTQPIAQYTQEIAATKLSWPILQQKKVIFLFLLLCVICTVLWFSSRNQ